MGIHCEINLRRQANGAFVTGSVVAGTARYTLDDDIVFNKITITLNGKGCLTVQNMRKKEDDDGVVKEEETYVNEHIVVLSDKRGHVLPAGSYESRFCFQLPLNVPPSVDFVKSGSSNTLRCQIAYYLQIKFNSPDGNKSFKTEIKVNPGGNPRLSTEPRIYDKQRKLIQLLRNSFVTVKATINNPIVSPGAKADLTYEVFNDTNVNFKCVESKLIQLTYLPESQTDETFSSEIVTDIKTAGVRSGEYQTINVEIPIPAAENSIENSKLIARDYFVKITVYLPLPYRNVSLKVPVQIAEVMEEGSPIELEPSSSSWEDIDEEVVDEFEEEETYK